MSPDIKGGMDIIECRAADVETDVHDGWPRRTV